MIRIAIELDDELVHRLDQTAKRTGKTRAAWTREAIEERLTARWPDWWLRVLGSWEDTRTPEEILTDIREGPDQRERPALS